MPRLPVWLWLVLGIAGLALGYLVVWLASECDAIESHDYPYDL